MNIEQAQSYKMDEKSDLSLAEIREISKKCNNDTFEVICLAYKLGYLRGSQNGK